MIRNWRGAGIAAGLAIAAIGGPGLSKGVAQGVAPVAEQATWSDAGPALRETQQGGRPTIVVATSASGTASDTLRAALPGLIGRACLLVEVDADEQREWVKQIGITGVPGVAVYAPSKSGIKLLGTRSGVADPASIAGWAGALLRPATATPARVDSKVVQAAYQQASSQNPTPQYTQYPAPAPPAPSPPVYAPTPPPVYYAPAPAPAPAPVYYTPAPSYYGPAPGSAPVFTNPAPAPLSVSPASAPILVNPPQQTIVIGPQPSPNVVAAAPPAPAPPAPAPAPTQMFLAPAPAPAPAPMQMVAMAPAPAPAPMQMVAMAPAPAPAPMQMVAMAPAPAPVQAVAAAPVSMTAQFQAAAPPAPAASPSSMVVAIKPQRLKNRIGTSIGQFLIEKNKQKFDLVQTATLASAPGLAPAQTFAYAAPAPAPQQAYCPPAPAPDYAPEPLPPLPSAQSACTACRGGHCLRHRHGK